MWYRWRQLFQSGLCVVVFRFIQLLRIVIWIFVLLLSSFSFVDIKRIARLHAIYSYLFANNFFWLNHFRYCIFNFSWALQVQVEECFAIIVRHQSIQLDRIHHDCQRWNIHSHRPIHVSTNRNIWFVEFCLSEFGISVHQTHAMWK